MVPREITSLQHPHVKRLVKLRKDRTYRNAEKQVLVVGKNLIHDLQVPLLEVLATKNFSTDLPITTTVSDGVMKKITGLENPEGIAALVALPEEEDLKKAKRVVVFDHITNPGNLGTLIRTAKGLGFDGAYLTSGCVDPYNDKALRAAKGATFTFPLSSGKLPETFHTYRADLGGRPPKETEFTAPLALILGNEANGPTLAGTAVTIPIVGIDSLNVAIAGGILLHHISEVTCH